MVPALPSIVQAALVVVSVVCALIVKCRSDWILKGPTVWSGKPLAVKDRLPPLQDPVAVLVALTEAEVLNTLLA